MPTKYLLLFSMKIKIKAKHSFSPIFTKVSSDYPFPPLLK